MATFHSSGGRVKIGANTVAEVSSAQWEGEVNLIEDSEISDAWSTFKPGRGKASGTVEVFWDDTDTNGQVALRNAFLNKTTVTLDLLPEGDTTGDDRFQATVYIQKFSVELPDDDIIKQSFEWTATGAPTQDTVP